MSRIHVMPPDLALKIAAGEVVERPAAAVKELIDNALDAGATTLRIEVRDAGLKMIRVTDDGCGIERADLALAFTSHATSKIASLDDLESLETLGFRGEALPSIAAVSRVEVHTRVRDEETGTRFIVEHGHVLDEGITSWPAGTRVAVNDLFANVPARRRFVRSARSESAQIQNVVTQYALARPDVRFALSLDDRDAFSSPGSGSLHDVVAAVYGPSLLDRLLPVDREEGGIAVQGLASSPQLHRQNRSAIHVVVNGRPIQNRSLGFALEEAYSGFLMTGRHPVAVIHLTVPPGEVDVNIHPAKSEVRFAREREVHGAIHRAVSASLLASRSEPREIAPVDTIEGVEEPLLTLADAAETEAQRAPALRVFGQSNRTFIIAEGPDGLYMIDQHAAHERILFDRLEGEMAAGEVAIQPLLEPATAELTPSQLLTLEENADLLQKAGFQIEPFGEGSCLIRAIPAIALRASPAELIGEVLSELETAPRTTAASERALATMACKAAVKAGDVLDVQEMRELVLQLERTPRPQTCPHGRPTMIHLSHTQLEREFGRR